MFIEKDDFEFPNEPKEAEYYREGAQDLICKLIPRDLLHSSDDLISRVRFIDMLPLIKSSELSQAPCGFSVLLLCKYRQNACHFFYEMISRHLLLKKRLNVELFFSSDVRLPRLYNEMLSVAEIVVHIKSMQDLQEVSRNFKQIETEIKLGIVSHYHAQRILEFKGLSADGKTAMIQEKICSLIQNRSQDFDKGIFSQMQRFLIACQEKFKNERDYHHISRIISNLYSLKKMLDQNIHTLPKQRHVILKFLKTRLISSQASQHSRSVLGVLAGLNFLREHEIFEQQHFLNAISRYIPNIRAVEGSFFSDRSLGSMIQTNYLEIEKMGNQDFTYDEIQTLRKNLPEDVKAHIEELTHPIFMPRNEEEVLKNIMALSRQLRLVSDLPQVIISFDGQKGSDLCFTIIMLRVLKMGGKSVSEMFERADSALKIVPDRIRSLGSIGRKHIKEAIVFRAAMGNLAFLRHDHSVDLYKARQYILSEMIRIFGDVRDYNGGMIGKQNEVLLALKRILGRTAGQNLLLLEKFFFALSPVELRSVMDTEHLKQFFLLLLQAQKSQQLFSKKSDWLFRQEEKRIFIVLPYRKLQLREKIEKAIEALQIPQYQMISFHIDLQDMQYMGFLFQSENIAEQNRFYDALEVVLRGTESLVQ